MKLLFEYPVYFLLLCLLAGAVFSVALYFFPRRNSSLPSSVRIILALLRFLAVSLLAFLLLSPLVRRNVNTREKPIVVIAQDASQSVDLSSPLFNRSTLRSLQSDYDVVLDTFGGATTDISSALSSIADRYMGRNLGAVVLASDGIYNQGINPSLTASSFTVPVYTVALGDTTTRCDAAIAHVRYNRIAYLGNQFPLEVTLRAVRLKGSRATLTVTHNGATLISQSVAYSDDPFSITLPLSLTADRPGLQSYTIALSPLDDETTQANNRCTIAVEVLDSRQKIAILAAVPHPDVSALRQSIQNNQNFEVEVFVGPQLQTFDPRKGNYSLLILHNLPHATVPVPGLPNPRSADRSATSLFNNTPAIFILGSQTDLARFNALHSGLEVIAKTQKTDQVTAIRNNAFGLFSLDDDIAARIEQLPPLLSPFGNYRPSGNMQSLFYARIGTFASDRPLIAFCQQGPVRRAFVAGEGLWLWRLHDYLATGSHNDFDRLVEKMIVYASMQHGKDRFRVVAERIYRDNEPVTLQAELYDDNYELVNTPQVQLTLSTPQGNKTYDFNPSGSSYSLSLGSLTPGQYSYTASTTFNGTPYTASGIFVVEQLNLEQLNLTADHSLLNTIARTTGAVMLQPDQCSSLPQLLQQRDDLKSVVYSHTRYTELLNLPLIFILLVLLLAAEWALRKYFLN